MAKEASKKSFLDFFKMKDLDDDEFDDDLFDDDDDDDDDDDALLIEDGYLDIVDEMWYIYAREEIRRGRLKESRNYSDEKIDAIMNSQLREEEFRKYCSVVIDNSEGLPAAFHQIDKKLGEYL